MLITAIGADWYHDDVLCVIPLNAVRRSPESQAPRTVRCPSVESSLQGAAP